MLEAGKIQTFIVAKSAFVQLKVRVCNKIIQYFCLTSCTVNKLLNFTLIPTDYYELLIKSCHEVT